MYFFYRILIVVLINIYTINLVAQNIIEAGDSIKISLEGYKEGNIQWQSSSNGDNWIDQQNFNSYTLKKTINQSSYFRAIINNCFKTYQSTIIHLNVLETNIDYLNYVGKYLANDSLKGRKPGTVCDTLSANFISHLFQKNSLSSFNGKSYLKSFITESSIKSYNGIPTFNVIGLKRGSDSILRNEVIIISAHYDHLGTDRNIVYNGADDNASGVTGLILLSKMFKSITTKRTLLFIATGAEEMGYLGMKNFIATGGINFKDIKYAFNLDQIGRMDNNTLYLYGNKYWSTRLSMIDILNEDSLSILYSPEIYFPGSISDHAPFFRSQDPIIPTLCFTTGNNIDKHRPTDDWEKINVAGLNKIILTSYRIISQIANE